MNNYGGELNSGLIALCEAPRSQPIVASKVHLSILGFSGDGAVRLALADLRDTQELPELIIRCSINYQAALQELITRIPQDIAALNERLPGAPACRLLPQRRPAQQQQLPASARIAHRPVMDPGRAQHHRVRGEVRPP
jgi:hypothetical protein